MRVVGRYRGCFSFRSARAGSFVLVLSTLFMVAYLSHVRGQVGPPQGGPNIIGVRISSRLDPSLSSSSSSSSITTTTTSPQQQQQQQGVSSHHPHHVDNVIPPPSGVGGNDEFSVPPLFISSSPLSPLQRLSHQPSPHVGNTPLSHTPRCIAVYYPGGDGFTQQMLGLWASWKYTVAKAVPIDLVVFAPKTALHKVPKKMKCVPASHSDSMLPKCILVEYNPPPHSYSFVPSVSFLLAPESLFLQRYFWILRTDLDTFVTPLLASVVVKTFTVGTHPGYALSQEHQEKIQWSSRALGMIHRGMSGIGSSWLGPPQQMREVARLTVLSMQYLLSSVFDGHHKWHGHVDGVWPHFYRGVVLLYASEMAINHAVPDVHFSRKMDVQTTEERDVLRDVFHLHSFHTDKMFSKFQMARGAYDGFVNMNNDIRIAPFYCLEMSRRGVGLKRGPIHLSSHGLLPHRDDQARGHLRCGLRGQSPLHLSLNRTHNAHVMVGGTSHGRGEPWTMRHDGLLRHEQQCMDVEHDGTVWGTWCKGGLHQRQLWNWMKHDQWLQHQPTQKCIGWNNPQQKQLILVDCGPNALTCTFAM